MRECAWILMCGLTVLAPGAVTAGDERGIDFSRDIRPILSENCYACHGPDAAKREGKLRLDTRDGIFGRGAEGVAVVPGDPDASELIFRIEEEDATVHMPPPASGKSLTPAQVARIRQWVENGAVWSGHWAYQGPTRPELVGSAGAALANNAIDRFIGVELPGRGLQAAPEADGPTLLRRLALDLTGLPPEPGLLESYVNDSRPDAYERVVDRLLASPHHGERLARYWLDLVRYADTVGYHGDNHQDVWMYRDWVIDAFRTNMPFDRFTIEQLAGDLLPNATPEQRIASGYNRILMTTREGGAQPKEYLAKYAADRVRDVSTVWLGATLGCAECHDHKFDPFTTRDFYQFAAYFADIEETAVGEQPPTRMPSADQAAQLARLASIRVGVEKELQTWTPALEEERQAWERARQALADRWIPLRIEGAESREGATLAAREDGSVFATGVVAPKDVYVVRGVSPLTRVTGIRLEALPEPSLPAQGPGRADNGNAVVSEVTLEVDGHRVALGAPSDSHHQRGFPAKHAVDGDVATGWALAPRAGMASELVFALDAPLDLVADAPWTITIEMQHGDRHTLGRFRVSATDAAAEVRAQAALPEEIEKIVATVEGARTQAQREALAAYFRTITPALAEARKALATVQAQEREIEAGVPTTLVARAMGTPREMRVLPRGNWLDESGPVVQPAPPGFLPGSAAEEGSVRASRLDLAQWLVAADNPLVARVFVNRLWMLFFGEGLASTEDDLGSQGAAPSHRELLDWLAVEFRESGWDARHMVRLLVLSRTYRQSSRPTEEGLASDPENRWLSRQGRPRLDAEVIRDQALAASGLLAREVGGPSARPYQPPGYWSYLNFPPREYEVDTGDGLYRRGLYTYWCRTFLHPSLLAFDAPTREECTVQRPRSNTPLQALVLLNDPTYVEAARVLAERLLRECGEGLDESLRTAYRRVLCRDPRAEELATLRELHARHLQRFREDSTAARELVSAGAWRVATDLDVAELAAWTSVMRVLLNLNEAITRY